MQSRTAAPTSPACGGCCMSTAPWCWSSASRCTALGADRDLFRLDDPSAVDRRRARGQPLGQLRPGAAVGPRAAVGQDPPGRPGRAGALHPDLGHHLGPCRAFPLPQPAADHPGRPLGVAARLCERPRRHEQAAGRPTPAGATRAGPDCSPGRLGPDRAGGPGGGHAGVGVPLLLVPTAMFGGWPWAPTPLTGRAIGAWTIGIGTIAAHAAWENDWWRPRPMMASHGAGRAAAHHRVALSDRPGLEPRGGRGLCVLPGHHPAAGGYGWWKTRHARPAPADTLLANVKVIATGCMEGRLASPALLVVPDNVWYGGVPRPTSPP